MNSCFKIHAEKGCPPRTRMLATTVDFLKESGQVLLIMTGPPLRCHPWHLSANANIVFALPLRLNHFPRKSHSLRRIYARGSSPFLLGYEKHPNCLGKTFENTCAKVKKLESSMCEKSRNTCGQFKNRN